MPDRSVVYRFVGDFRSLSAGLTAAGRNVTELGVKMTALDKNGAKMRAGLTAVGDTAGKVGLVAAAGLGAFVVASARFDQAMSNVQAATHETSDNMGLLREAAIKAGADTAYSATEAAGAIEELAKAGVSTRDILDGGLTGALNLAAAGGMDVAAAAETAATALTQFDLAGSDVEHVADLLAAGAGKAQGSVDDLGMALKQSGLVASQTGLSIEETTGTLSAFASAGLIGSDAGTSFKTMLQSLTPSSVKAKEEMERLGISAYDAQGNFVGMTEFAARLRAGLSDLSTEQQNAALKTIFGSDAVRAASVIYEQGADGIQGWIDKTNDSGYAAETAATRMDNLAGDLEKLGGSLETALISGGSGTQGPLRELVQGATAAVDAFADLPPAAQNTTTALLGITAVTGGGLWFGSKVVTGIVDTKQALSDLGLTAGGANGKLKTLAARGGGLVLLTTAMIGAAEAVDRLNGSFEASTLDRDFEALAGGDVTDNMESLVDSLETLRKAGSVPALADLSGEVVTLFGALGNTNVDQAADDIKALDEYLAGLVESGNAELAAAQFNALVEGLAAAEHTQPERVLDDVTGMLEQYSVALENAGGRGGVFVDFMGNLSAGLSAAIGATDGAAGATSGFASSAVEAAGASAEEAKALRDATDAMREKTSAALAAFDAETAYRQALKDAQAQAKTNSAGIRGNTEDVLANRSALSQLAGSWNNQSNAVKNNVQRYKDARKAFIDTATAMGVPEEAARDLAKAYLDIPKSKVTNVSETGVDETTARVRELNRELARVVDRSITISANVVRNGLNSLGFAAGGHIQAGSPTAVPAHLTGAAA